MTLITDFGLRDSYVAEVKAVLLSRAPRVQIVDVTHLCEPQDVIGGSVVLERAIRAFGPGTIHLAIVDPGVGTARRILIASVAGQRVICPDNGLLTWAWRRLEHEPRARELTWRPSRRGLAAGEASRTFHGRDIMAPAAAELARGVSPARLGRAKILPELLEIAPADSLEKPGRILRIDRFGNAITNILAELMQRVAVGSVQVGRRSIPLGETYADVAIGKPVALVGSSGLVELAVRNGSAAAALGLRVGDPVRLKVARDVTRR